MPLNLSESFYPAYKAANSTFSAATFSCAEETVTGLYCGKIIGEYLEKLIDLNHPRQRAQKLITYLIGAFTRISITTKTASFKPTDPDDEVFLLCALDGQADYLVSDDNALLALTPNYAKPVICNGTSAATQLGA